MMRGRRMRMMRNEVKEKVVDDDDDDVTFLRATPAGWEQLPSSQTEQLWTETSPSPPGLTGNKKQQIKTF